MNRRNNRQWTGEKIQSWHTELIRGEATIERFIRQRRQGLISACLFVFALSLLIGIAGQLPTPVTKTPPPVLTLDDHSLLQQVQTDHVLAVILQGDELHGLLDAPFSSTAHSSTMRSASSRRNDAQDIATWHTYVLTGYHLLLAQPRNTNGVIAPFASAIDPQRMFFTWLPPGHATSLLPVLLRHHVLVQTLPPEQTVPTEVRWRALTLAFLLMSLPLLLTYASGSLNASGSNRERMTRFSKCHMQRYQFERHKPLAAAETALPITAELGLLRPSEERVTFADVAGIDEVRADLEELVEFLRHSERVGRLGARLPRGVLLSGPPGTGKTLLAKALAGEAGVPFFSLSASSFVEMFVGVGASRVRDLFKQAREAAPCVIFLDELDAVGGKRGTNQFFNDEREQTLNQLLIELDGFASREAVVVLAATNRADKLDAALLRPGRFDRQLTVSLPDRAGREAILRVHTRRTPLREDVSLALLGRLTVGMSGADLANLVNEAAIAAARRELDQLTPECFELALMRMQVGARRAVVMSEADRRIIAYHEAGHALVAHYTPHADVVNRVSILPHGQKIGATHLLAEEDRYLWSRKALQARIVVGLGGRAAEELIFGAQAVTTGAEDDLQTVTDIARRMVTRWGMSERIGPLFVTGESTQYEPALSQRPFGNSTLREGVKPASPLAPSSSTMATEIDREVHRLLSEGYQSATALLDEHRDQLMMLAEALIQYEQLDRTQFEQCLQSITAHSDSTNMSTA